MARQLQKYDCLVIGGGHNGLIAAAYLARAGRSVGVLERRPVLGGCSVTEELWPGYRVSTAAYVISLFLPEIISELRLGDHQLKILPRQPSSYTPLPDGRSLLMGSDREATLGQIARYSARDATAFPEYEAMLERVARVLEPMLEKPAPNPLPLPQDWRKRGVTERFRELGRCWPLYRMAGELGADLPEAIELLTGAARPILERWFESEVLRATLATDAIIGAFAPPSAPGTAYVLLHHVMGMAGGARGIWGYVQGGMGGLAEALERVCHELQVTIHREAPVVRILTDQGRVRGVQLEDGSVFEAPVVASSIDAHQTFRRLCEPGVLPADFLRAIDRIDYNSASAKVNLALAEPPCFRADPSEGIAPHHHGTMHIGPSLDYIERAYDDAKYGNPSREPVLEMTMASAGDPSLAPAGKHVMSIFVQYAPYTLADGADWETETEAFGDRCIAQLARYAPNVPGAIEHRQVLSPPDLERIYGLTGGHIMQGAMDLNHLFFLRPAPGWADHRTPLGGLYLCGAASHPGGGVIGACGRNAAEAILRD